MILTILLKPQIQKQIKNPVSVNCLMYYRNWILNSLESNPITIQVLHYYQCFYFSENPRQL